MSQSLGEKLRQAREQRGISISEVADQTRISPIYIESIEKDDYKPLPGGIFNKGFVKSYAKFIGLDEQEALNDYAKIAAANEIVVTHDQKVYRPEVLTDETASSSMLPTIVFAAIILALMTGGILFLVNYLQTREPSTPAVANTTNSNAAINPDVHVAAPEQTNAPGMDTVKVEFRAAADAISLASESDGKKATETVASGSGIAFEPRQSLKLSYSKSLAQSAQLLINGKSIALPASPQNPRRNAIEIEINRDNLAKIWQDGKISFDSAESVDPVPVANSTPVDPAATAVRTPAPIRPATTPTPRVAATPVRTPPPANTGAATPRSTPN